MGALSAIHPWTHSKPLNFWPLLESLLEINKISYIDAAIAYQILEEESFLLEEAAIFICLLSSVSRKGHLCLEVSEASFEEMFETIWNISKQEERHCLAEKSLEGFLSLPPSIKQIVKARDLLEKAPICQFENLCYFQKQWNMETCYIKALLSHLKTRPFPLLDQEKINSETDENVLSCKLNKEQAGAIKKAVDSPLTLITGGPGTGKTHTAGILVKTFWQASGKKIKIALAAPTGKAASNLQASFSLRADTLKDFPPIQAKTLHALIGWTKDKEEETHLIDADLLIVDESSMIDIKLMERLLNALKPGTRLILIGDKDQLASVEAGSIFADLLEAAEKGIISASVATLKECLRLESQELIQFSEKIKEGDHQSIEQLLNEGLSLCVSWNKIEKNDPLFKTFFSKFEPCIAKEAADIQENAEKFFEKMKSYRLLSTLRQGPLGSDEINHKIYELIIKKLPSSGFGLFPIMALENDYQNELFNGETGILFRRLPLDSFSEEDFALFPKGEAGTYKKIALPCLAAYQYAYCFSIHKSQGSEFERVGIVMPEGSEKFGREIFYTGVTRSKKEVEIWASKETLFQILRKCEKRSSGFRLKIEAK